MIARCIRRSAAVSSGGVVKPNGGFAMRLARTIFADIRADLRAVVAPAASCAFLLRLCILIACVAASPGSGADAASASSHPKAATEASIAQRFQVEMRDARGIAGTATMGITFDDGSVLTFDLVHAAPNPRARPPGSKAQRFMQEVKKFDLSSDGFILTFADGSTTHFDLSNLISSRRAN